MKLIKKIHAVVFYFSQTQYVSEMWSTPNTLNAHEKKNLFILLN